MEFIIVLSLFLFCKINEASPPDLCSEDKPFRSNDRYCHNFSELCLKTGDDQCNQLLNACKQCPPNNTVLTILRNIWQMSILQSNLTQQIIPNIIAQLNLTQKSVINKSNESSPTLSNKSCDILVINGIIAFLVILILVLSLEIRFKLLTKYFKGCGKKNNSQYFLLESRKRIFYKDMFNKMLELESKINESINNQDKNFESTFQKMIDKIYPLQSPSKDYKITAVKFQFDDIDQEPIELYVHNNHNIVQVKQQICAKLPHSKPEDYKIMKLKYNGIILNDDNQYLLENIDTSNKVVNCFIDSSINASDIVVVKLQGKMRLPDIIQINKNETIDKLNEMIEKIISSKNFTLFKEFLDDKNQMKKSLFKLDSVCRENELIDGNCIRIIQKEEGILKIESIFDEKFSMPTTYKNTDKISSLMEFVNKSYNWQPNEFVLFCNNQYLEENKYICEYGICAESTVKICNIVKMKGIKKDYICESDTNWELYRIIKPPNDTKILYKKYKIITVETWKSQDWMINELKTFLVTKNHQRFIKLSGVYFDENMLYVAMENMENGTLKHYLRKNKNFEKKLISNWSLQILEGLEFLHEKNIVHRDLNPSNILVNNNTDLKLSSFNLSKYEKIFGPATFCENKELLETLKVRYMAPELLNGEDYKFPCDIWSFGAVLLRIVSGKKPFPKMSKREVKFYIINCETVDFQLSDRYESDLFLKSFIASCLKRNPGERYKMENLKKIKTFISD